MESGVRTVQRSDTPCKGVIRNGGCFMRTWIGYDAVGASFLVRMGRGVVTAITHARDNLDHLVIEIDVDKPIRNPRALCIRVKGRAEQEQRAAAVARDALASGESTEWVIEWHRNAEVPSTVPITDLDLASDAVGRLVSMDVVTAPVDDDAFDEVIGSLADPTEGGTP